MLSALSYSENRQDGKWEYKDRRTENKDGGVAQQVEGEKG